MKSRKKSIRLQAFVFLIIFILLFSVIGVVVVYLRGIQEQTSYAVPVTTTPIDETAIQIAPQRDGVLTVTENDVETETEIEQNDKELDQNTIIIPGLDNEETGTEIAEVNEGENEAPEEDTVDDNAPEISIEAEIQAETE